MNIENLIELGRVTKSIKINGIEIQMHTLSTEEELKAYEATSNKILDTYSRLRALEVETLVNAIDKINGIPVSENEKREFLNKMQKATKDKLVDFYNQLDQESIQNIKIENVKNG